MPVFLCVWGAEGGAGKCQTGCMCLCLYMCLSFSVCVCMCLCVSVCICLSAGLCVNLCVSLCIFLCVCMSVFACFCLCFCVSMSLSLHTRACGGGRDEGVRNAFESSLGSLREGGSQHRWPNFSHQKPPLKLQTTYLAAPVAVACVSSKEQGNSVWLRGVGKSREEPEW